MKKLPGTPINEIADLSVEDRSYLQGGQNWMIRMYFYLENGLNILNEFRNLGFLLVALYVALHLDGVQGIMITIGIAVPAVVLLIWAGRYNVHTLSRMKDWLSMRFSTHYGIRTFNHQEQQTALLTEIRDMLKAQQHNEQAAKMNKEPSS